MRHVRWLGAGVVLVLAAVACFVSGTTTHLRVCEPGDVGEWICRPMTMSDPQVLITLVLAALLLLPDLSRIKIAGLVEVERKIDDTTHKVEESNAAIERVALNVQTLVTARATATSQSGPTLIFGQGPGGPFDLANIERKGDEFLAR